MPKALLTKATLKSSATKISLILKFCSRCWIRFMPDVPPIPKKCAKTRSKSLLPPRFANKSVPLPHRHKVCLSEQYQPPAPRHHFLPVRCLFCSLYPVPYLSAVYAFSSGFKAFCQPFAAREKVKPRPLRRVFSPGLQRIPHTAP